MNDKAPLIEARGLFKRYDVGASLVDALRGVDLVVRAGESVAITGASGSGKSTLLHILGCLDRPTTGEYLLDGRDLSRLGDADLSRIRLTKIGFVFQTFHLLPHRTVFENVALPFFYRGAGRAETRGRTDYALQRVGLMDRARHLPNQLSGGEMQRAAIARALAGDPILVLADEPTGNLDSANGRTVIDLFLELNREGTTLVIATHNIEVAARCGRTISLRDGRVEAGAP